MLSWTQGIVQGNGSSADALSIPRAGEVHNFCLGRVKGQAKRGMSERQTCECRPSLLGAGGRCLMRIFA